MPTVTEIYRILVETEGGRELVSLNRTLQKTTSDFAVANKQVKGFNNSMSVLGKTTKSVGQRNNALTNVAYQVSDMAVQFEMGTDAMRIFGQQVPQMLGGFGLLGAGLGAAAAVIPVFIKLMRGDMAPSIDGVEKSLESLNEAFDEYDKLMRAANGSTAQLAEGFGSATPAIRGFVAQLAYFSKMELDKKVRESAQAINDLVNSDLLSGFGAGSTRMEKIRDDILELNSTIRMSDREALNDYLNLIAQLDNPNLTNDQLITLLAEINSLTLEYAGSLEEANTTQRSILQATALAAIEAEKIRDAEKAASAEAVRYAGQTQEIARQKKLEAEAAERASIAARVQYGYLRALGDEQRRKAKEDERSLAAYKEYYRTLQEGVKLEKDAERSKQAYIIYYNSRIAGEALRVAADNAKDLERQLTTAAWAARQVSEAVMEIQSQTSSINLSNVGLSAEIAALEEGLSPERAANAGKIAESWANAREALDNATSYGQITATVNAQNEYVASLGEEATLQEKRTALLKKYNEAQKEASGSGDLSKSESEALREYNKRVDDLRSFALSARTPVEVLNDDINKFTTELDLLGDELTGQEYEYAVRGLELMKKEMEGTSEVAKAVRDSFDTSFNNMFGSLIDQTKTVTEAFQDMLVDIASMIAKFMVSRQIEALLNLLMPVTGSTSTSGGIGQLYSAQIPQTRRRFGPVQIPDALGEPIYNRDGIPNNQTTRMIASNQIPSTSGYIPQSSGGDVYVNVNNNTDSQVSVEENQDTMGNKTIDIYVESRVKDIFARGGMDKILQSSYGIKRRPR